MNMIWKLCKGYDMKLTLTAIAILTVLLLASCRPEEQAASEEQSQPAPVEQALSPHPPTAQAAVHVGTVQEVLQASAYTYLRVKEQDQDVWVAITKREMPVGEKVSFGDALEMKNFHSKDLDRTFESIYFLNDILTGAAAADSGASAMSATPAMPGMASHQGKVTAEKIEVSVDPTEGGIRIGALFADPQAYAGKSVRIRGQVTKVNRAIMGRNWVHLQDGTGEAQGYDLTITTQDDAMPGEVVTFEGTIALNRDFGAGYAYDLLMEDARRQSE